LHRGLESADGSDSPCMASRPGACCGSRLRRNIELSRQIPCLCVFLDSVYSSLSYAVYTVRKSKEDLTSPAACLENNGQVIEQYLQMTIEILGTSQYQPSDEVSKRCTCIIMYMIMALQWQLKVVGFKSRLSTCGEMERTTGTNEIGEDRRWLGSWPAIGLGKAVMKSLKRLP
jgi:hypothetical protein